MLKKLWCLIGLVLCLVSCGEDGPSPEEVKEQEFREGIVGTWIYSHPELGQWEEWICTASGKIYVSYVTGVNMEEIQLEKKSGTYIVSGEKLNVVLAGTANEYKLSSINETELTCTLVSLGRTFTYSKQLDEIKLNSGEDYSIDAGKWFASDVSVYACKSHNPTIASVDSNGKVVAKEAGFTYIDVATSAGTFVVRVNVKDGNNLFPDYSASLGMNAQQVKERWGNDYYYDKEDGLAYLINNEYVTNVLFFTDENKDVSHCWLLLNTVQTGKEERRNAVHTCLNTKYTYLSTEEDGVMLYCNFNSGDDLLFYVLYSPNEETIAYVKYEPKGLWSDYSLDFGKTYNQLKSEYGEPALVEGAYIYYLEENDYIDFRVYVLYESTQKVFNVFAFLRNNFDGQTILDELNRNYVYYEKGSLPSENFFAFKNEEETVGVIFNGPEGYLQYVDLTVSSSSRTGEEWMPSMEKSFRKLHMVRQKK